VLFYVQEGGTRDASTFRSENELPPVVRTSCVVVSSRTCKQRVFFTEVESGRQRPISLPQHFLGGNVFKGCAKQVCACANQLKKL
jgi:hypothetical protein